MGSRTTWKIDTGNPEGDTSLHVYSHWGGWDKIETTRRAIAAARPRWDDVPYSTRIIVSQIIGSEWNEETGFGLALGPSNDYVFEEEHIYCDINTESQWVSFGCGMWAGSFEEFVDSDFGLELFNEICSNCQEMREDCEHHDLCDFNEEDED